MDVNLRDPNQISNRIYVGHLNESIKQELLEIKFSPYGKIVGILRTQPGFAFVQYDQPSSATAAINAENGSMLNGQRIMVKQAEMKSQKHKLPPGEMKEPGDDEPMNKKYFSNANEYYGNNSIMADVEDDSQVNHVEIIVEKQLTSYADGIAKKLKMVGMRADILYPNPIFPMAKMLGRLQSKGVLYAIQINQMNVQQASFTFTILYGDATEHRDIPLDDGIRFIYNDYANKTKGISQYKSQTHPDAIQTLLKTLAENRSLTVLQYEHLIKYLTSRREMQIKAEIGEEMSETNSPQMPPVSSVSSFAPQQSKPQDAMSEMQKKILEALNKKPLTEMIAKKVVEKPQSTISKDKREELRASLMNNANVKAAMAMLLKKN